MVSKYNKTAKTKTIKHEDCIFIMRFRNAKIAIQQIRNGEWEPRWNDLCKEHVTAHKDGMELWMGNGPFFCEINVTSGEVYFGLFWRHWVYWAAVRKFKRDADKRYKRENYKQPLL